MLAADPVGPTTSEATRILDDAMNALLGPRTKRVRTDDGRVIVATAPSIYTEMRDSTAGQMGTRVGGKARSLPPAWVGCLDWLVKVETVVREWSGVRDVAAGFDLIGNRVWVPEDVPAVLAMAVEIGDWVADAERLLDARAQFPVTGACPECGVERVAVSTDDGGTGWRPALLVSVAGGKCEACGHWWAADELADLAAAVGAVSMVGTDR